MKAIHDVFWDGHMCNRLKDHTKPCKCSCGSTLPAGHKDVAGNDTESAIFNPKKHA